ncbi:hypothetical protein CH252_33825 [Rhodococcus sp. 06-1477-1B]|uniref:hypothetical protein n=1 Tax=Rhodococcus sp. 06-1474-1B TaxID=2022499 RepID=UPI000B9B67AF|nr:hypothetical protein [Rhodococcus sp. 06-1474-1B]OZD36995.1 hypothetical protein CH252_33825 [Rhodococcus sp. 06-1477-1B]OZD52081.1 hypothetical protein CH266_09220 [Rhodococcus sp. 06-1474-1B]
MHVRKARIGDDGFRKTPRYQQLNAASVVFLGSLVVIGTFRMAETSDSIRLAAHSAILVAVAAAIVYGLKRTDRKPTLLLPRMTLVLFGLGSLVCVVAGDYLPAVVAAIQAVILPLFMLDDRVNALYRYTPDVS